MISKQRYLLAKRVTLLGAIINFALGLVKLWGGFVWHSHALIADGIHSFSDLLTDVLVLFASKYGSHEADKSHPYGHQRIETASTLFLSLLLILAGLAIIYDSGFEILKKTHEMPGLPTLFIALASTFANEMLFHYTHYIGKKINSALITANAWHHRSDAGSSLVVCIGLIGSFLGAVYLDAVAAVIVGCLIVKMGISYGWRSVTELVDSSIEDEMTKKVEKIILQTDGVQKLHQLRSRLMGNDIFLDVHVLVSPFISVSEGHYIAQKVHRTLMSHIPAVKDVTVHIDPEDDELECPSLNLPDRATLNKELLHALYKSYPEIKSITLHYIEGSILIDIYFYDLRGHLKEIKQEILKHADKIASLSQIRFYVKIDEIVLAKEKSSP